MLEGFDLLRNSLRFTPGSLGVEKRLHRLGCEDLAAALAENSRSFELNHNTSKASRRHNSPCKCGIRVCSGHQDCVHQWLRRETAMNFRSLEDRWAGRAPAMWACHFFLEAAGELYHLGLRGLAPLLVQSGTSCRRGENSKLIVSVSSKISSFLLLVPNFDL